MKKVQTKNKLKGLFGLFAAFAMAIGVGVSLAPKDVVKTEAATVSETVNTRTAASITAAKFTHTNVEFVTSAGGYNKQSAGHHYQTGSGFFDENIEVTEISITSLQLGTFGTWSGAKTVTLSLILMNNSVEGDSVDYTTAGLGSSVSTTTGLISDITTFKLSGLAGKDFNGFKLKLKTFTTSSETVRFAGFGYSYNHQPKQTEGPQLTDILVSNDPTNKVYEDGQVFDKTGMVITGIYDEGPNQTIDNANVVVTPNIMSLGVTSVQVSFGGFSKTISGITVNAATAGTVLYRVSAKDTLTAEGPAPAGSTSSIVESYVTSQQITNGNSQIVTLTGFNNVKITEITLSMKSNASGGSGNFAYSLNSGTTYTNIIGTAAFNNSAWNGSYSTTFVSVVKSVNIEVQSTVMLRIAATVNSLFCESYQVKWEKQEAAVLTGLTMNKPTVSIVEEETEQLVVTPVPGAAAYDVEWESSDEDVAAVDQNGLVTAVSVGSATITATDKTNTSISAQSIVTVTPAPVYDYFKKISGVSQLHFGATYVIASEDGTGALRNEASSNNIPVQTTITKNGDIRDQDILMKVTLEIGSVAGTYAFKSISTHAASNGKYLYAAGGTSSNHLKLQATITDDASWLISFDDGVPTIVAQGPSDRNYLRYNPGNNPPIFSAYAVGSSVQTPAYLYLLEDSVDAVVSANMVAAEINSGLGNNAKTNCLTALPILESAYNRLSPEAKTIFDNSEDVNFVDARNRIAYMTAWVASQSGGGAGKISTPINDDNSLTTTIIIGVIGLTTLAGYYFLQKKIRLC